MEFEGLILLLEYFLPLFGVIAIVVLAGIYHGKKRWLVVIIGPAILFGLQTLLLRYNIIEGNLLTAAIYGLMIMGLWYYYIILLVFGAYKWLKARGQERRK